MIVFSYLLISLRFKNRQVYSIYQATLCSRFLLQSFLNPFCVNFCSARSLDGSGRKGMLLTFDDLIRAASFSVITH